MKKIVTLFLLAVLVLMMLVSCSEQPEKKKAVNEVLYVFNWGEYISDGSEDSVDTNAEFEAYCREELGRNVTVNYSTFSSNEDLYAKISSGAANYDVIIPSDYMIQRMVEEELLAPLDLSLIPNYDDIDDAFKGANVYYEDGIDDEVIYSVPYMYGVVGVIYNTTFVPEEEEDIGSWNLMWNEKYKGNILQFNNSRDAFGTALYKLGYSVNTDSEEEWREALALLKEQKSIVQGYVMDEIFNKMQSGSAAVAAYYAGDFLTMYMENEDLEFFYPSEGTNYYVDAMCIPKASQNQELANIYINFMCSEDIAVANAEYTLYASPVTTVRENEEYNDYLMNDVKDNAFDILYGEMAENVQKEPYHNLDVDKLTMLNTFWEELKVESSMSVSIIVICILIICGLIALAVWQVLKKKRWEKLY